MATGSSSEMLTVLLLLLLPSQAKHDCQVGHNKPLWEGVLSVSTYIGFNGKFLFRLSVSSSIPFIRPHRKQMAPGTSKGEPLIIDGWILHTFLGIRCLRSLFSPHFTVRFAWIDTVMFSVRPRCDPSCSRNFGAEEEEDWFPFSLFRRLMALVNHSPFRRSIPPSLYT